MPLTSALLPPVNITVANIATVDAFKPLLVTTIGTVATADTVSVTIKVANTINVEYSISVTVMSTITVIVTVNLPVTSMVYVTDAVNLPVPVIYLLAGKIAGTVLFTITATVNVA